MLSEHLYPPNSVQLSRRIHYASLPVLTRLDHCSGGRRGREGLGQLSGRRRQPPSPLITAQRSPCVEPQRGVPGVNGAVESPLKHNKETAD